MPSSSRVGIPNESTNRPIQQEPASSPPAQQPGAGYASSIVQTAAGPLPASEYVQLLEQQARAASGLAPAPTPTTVQEARQQEGPQVTVQGPFPPYTIPKGTLIPIVLESSVNSDLGGMILARTTTDIYDRTKRQVLIPRGAEVVSNYGSVAAYGQNRLDVAASRLNLPDGRYVDFENAYAYDPQGRIGLSDRVDRHILSKFGSIAVLSLTGVAVSVGAGFTNSSDVVEFEGPDGRSVVIPLETRYRSAEDIAAQRIINEVNRVLSKQMDRALDRPSTIKLRSGLRGTLILGDDVDMARPYYENNQEPDPFGQSPFDVRPGARPSVPQPPSIPPAPGAEPTRRFIARENY